MEKENTEINNEIAEKYITHISEVSKGKRPLVIIQCMTYNHEPYLRDTLEGFVIQQTTFPFVAIVHDDASTDRTAEILREYADKYPDIILPIIEKENQYSKRDGALGRIMNKASEESGAKYIAYCEGDDYWTDPLKLQKQVDFLEANPDYGLCYTRIQKYIQKDKIFTDIWGGPGESFESLVKANPIPTLTVVLRVKIYFLYLGDIHPETKGWLMGDYPCWLYFAANSKIKFINEMTGVYRVLVESASHSRTYRKRLQFALSSSQIVSYFLEREGYDFSVAALSEIALKMQLAVLNKDKTEILKLKEILKNQLRTTTKSKERIKALLLLKFPLIITYLLKLKRTI